MSEPDIEDVLRQEVMRPKVRNFQPVAQGLADALAAADLPLVDRERGIAVIRLDPELAERAHELANWLDLLDRWIEKLAEAGDERAAAFLDANGADRTAVQDELRRWAARIIGGESE